MIDESRCIRSTYISVHILLDITLYNTYILIALKSKNHELVGL